MITGIISLSICVYIVGVLITTVGCDIFKVHPSNIVSTIFGWPWNLIKLIVITIIKIPKFTNNFILKVSDKRIQKKLRKITGPEDDYDEELID
jgi:hypothetical protein